MNIMKSAPKKVTVRTDPLHIYGSTYMNIGHLTIIVRPESHGIMFLSFVNHLHLLWQRNNRLCLTKTGVRTAGCPCARGHAEAHVVSIADLEVAALTWVMLHLYGDLNLCRLLWLGSIFSLFWQLFSSVCFRFSRFFPNFIITIAMRAPFRHLKGT